eukprot:CAMPEP_0117014828 /NCGR_PEP_ID=MMETSP0472-20121206/11959_1 /TAXON_ID=693140 ORGANISM="Tiarina fusus, Strain LIS" /NCGR_SAMPLE_ID=MMETSP0472 /ASSEMBLY_ACC=CAM_ASM_000603 /LENGTH=86 /DNA_ID=CAMNT_0004718489 /DNA_START=12 /DNA_END=272 /DNA_ORIENTATION=+
MVGYGHAENGEYCVNFSFDNSNAGNKVMKQYKDSLSIYAGWTIDLNGGHCDTKRYSERLPSIQSTPAHFPAGVARATSEYSINWAG